jgi:serine/threonine-protein kinase HipA
LLPPEQAPEGQAHLKPLPYQELSRRIANLPQTTLTRDAPKRMSLAGAQHKMLVVLKGADLYEPVGATPSTHILKPDHPASDTYPASVYLEWLTMRLAGAARLDVPAVQLLHVPQPVYVIERFDRRFAAHGLSPKTGLEPPTVARVHVIDACQLLNKSRVYKHSGASVQALRAVVLACGDELTLPVRLFRWLVFNLLVANDDCHLKNLSFVVTPARVDLAPHYDLLATGVYHTRAFADEQATWPAVPLAVRISEEVTRFDQVTPAEVLNAARTLGVPPSVAVRAVQEVVSRTLREFDAVFAAHYPAQVGLQEQMRRQAMKAQQQLPARVDETPVMPGWTGNAGNAVSVCAAEQAQHLKILRVLRFMVLPEMAQRLLGGRELNGIS